MSFQIFIPGACGASHDRLREVGLEDLLSPNDDPPTCGETLRGPTGGPGQLWGWTTATTILSFIPDRHEAMPCVADPDRNLAAGRFWWIFVKGQKPTEASLRRRDMFGGSMAALADGTEWKVPNVMELPQTFDFDQGGQIVRRPDDQWRSFVDDAEWAVNQFFGGESVQRDWRREVTVAARFLAANYRLNRELLIRLQMITPKNVYGVLARGIDRDRIRQLESKLKNLEGGAATPAGSAA